MTGSCDEYVKNIHRPIPTICQSLQSGVRNLHSVCVLGDSGAKLCSLQAQTWANPFIYFCGGDRRGAGVRHV